MKSSVYVVHINIKDTAYGFFVCFVLFSNLERTNPLIAFLYLKNITIFQQEMKIGVGRVVTSNSIGHGCCRGNVLDSLIISICEFACIDKAWGAIHHIKYLSAL